MNVIEALNIAKEHGKKVRPKNQNTWFIKYENGKFMQYNTYFKRCDMYCYVTTEYILEDWKVIEEKTSKQTQHKIDSMKFQIVRYCKNTGCCNSECELYRKCIDKVQVDDGYFPNVNLLDDWSLKEIVEAYHILKNAGEI